MVKQLIYDSCMIVKKETIISIYHDIQVVHKKHDGMIVVFLKSIIVLTNLNRKCRFIRYFSLERIVTDKVQIRSESTDRFPAIQFCFQHTKFTAGSGMAKHPALLHTVHIWLRYNLHEPG